MKLLQYSVFRRDTHDASGKAKWDASDILLDMGFEELYLPSKYRPIRVIQQLAHTLSANKSTIMAIQYPANKAFFYRILSHKRVKSFAIIHDLESLRLQTDLEKDISILNGFAAVISHNPSMTRVLIEGGYEGNIVELGLFDYLGFRGEISGDFDRSVVAFAGNLSKASFINKLSKTGLKVDLFGGPKPDTMALGNTVRYSGSFPSNIVPGVLTGGWGLVWDGDSIDTCTGNTGQYLKYNNPHKASMYIIAEKPLIVWAQSAIAPYVLKRRIGIVVNNLYEAHDYISSCSDSDYGQMLEGVKREKRELSTGAHLRASVQKVLTSMRDF